MVLGSNIHQHHIFKNCFGMANSNELHDTDDKFSSNEYFKSLEKWVQDVTLWQHFSYISMQSFMMNQAASFRPSGTTQQSANLRNLHFNNTYQSPSHIRGTSSILKNRQKLNINIS